MTDQVDAREVLSLPSVEVDGIAVRVRQAALESVAIGAVSIDGGSGADVLNFATSASGRTVNATTTGTLDGLGGDVKSLVIGSGVGDLANEFASKGGGETLVVDSGDLANYNVDWRN